MNREEIKAILPHREPMLLLDEVRLENGVAVGSYTVPEDAFFVSGHFPGNPVVPGVILCEMMGQSACVLVAEHAYTPYLTGMNRVKFKQKVFPGDKVTFRSELIKKKSVFYFIKSAGYVGETLCAEAELSFAVLPE